MPKRLKDIVSYSNDRISLDDITIESYVTTDNLLQNKQGKVFAEKLPKQNSNTVTKFSKGDILVGNIRPYLKKIWLADITGGSSTDVLTFKVKNGFNPQFVFYSLFRDDFFDHMMNGSKGTKMPRGDKKQILEFTIPDFNLLTQSQIAKVLSDLDAKIELNNKINAQLEAMAKLIYDYWFVQFEFPTSEAQAQRIGNLSLVGKPYKSSGGKMVYNPELKREIPEGWSSGLLSDFAKITMGQSPAGSSYNEEGIGTVFYQGSTDFGLRFPTVRKYTTEPSRMAKENDILLSVRAPVGTLNQAMENCCIGRGLAALREKEGSNSFLWSQMGYYKQIFDRSNASGTTFGSITKDELFGLKLCIPNNKTLKSFKKIVDPFHDKIILNSKENLHLTNLRDWLLPMLMNGQVRVANALEKGNLGEVESGLGMVAEDASKYEK
jgi:type I restriction enzyme, S subunit